MNFQKLPVLLNWMLSLVVAGYVSELIWSVNSTFSHFVLFLFILSLIYMLVISCVSYSGPLLLQSNQNSWSYALLCLLSLYVLSLCLPLGCSLIDMPFSPPLYSSLPRPIAPSPLPWHPSFSFLHFTVTLLNPGHKVAVGDIVKVTNGQHLPADMVIVSSRSDFSVYMNVCFCLHLCMSFNMCPQLI